MVGLLTFSKILKWLFSHYRNQTLAVLTGFIFGSLNKIWPWKKVLETKLIENKIVIIKEVSISPFSFDGNMQLAQAIILAIIGFAVILLLEKLAVSADK